MDKHQGGSNMNSLEHCPKCGELFSVKVIKTFGKTIKSCKKCDYQESNDN